MVRLILKVLVICCITSTLIACSSMNSRKEEKLADIYFDSGTKFLSTGNFSDALKVFEKAKAVKKDLPIFWNNLGLAYVGLKKYNLGHKQFKKALEINPKFTEAHNNIGVTYMIQMNYAAAKRHLEIVVNDLTFYNRAMSYYNLGRVALKEKNYADAKAQLNNALSINENYCPAWLKLGETEWLLKNYAASKSAITKGSTKICYGYTEAHFRLANLYVKEGDREAARKKYSEIIERFPRTKWAEKSETKLLSLKEINE